MSEYLRAPAYPLISSDPYFSVWSEADHLYDDWPRHWTGAPHSLFGAIRVDGVPMRFMGGAFSPNDTVSQVCAEVRPTQTLYTFTAGPIQLIVTFCSPRLLDDLELVSRPATYITAQVSSTDGAFHKVELYLDVSAELTVDKPSQLVRWFRKSTPPLTLLALESVEQNILQKSGDDLRIDWGTLYLAVSPDWQQTCLCDATRARTSFYADGRLSSEDDPMVPRAANSFGGPVAAVVTDLGEIGRDSRQVHAIVAYDDVYSIEYFHEPLRAWWRRAPGMTAERMIAKAEGDYESVVSRCTAFDAELLREATTVGGGEYAALCALAYRQAISAHKLVQGPKGEILFLSKENNSNGCINTVDVTYPSTPLFLIYNPTLVKGMLDGIFDYCRGDKGWPYEFAAHDLGTYPRANGQVYGELRLDRQMPVEECGNMIIVSTAIVQREGKPDYARQQWDMLSQWAQYLRRNGLDPENQLCTDDFAGHLAHNANLSLKAIIALGCYGYLAGQLGYADLHDEYMAIARDYAAKWPRMADDGDHYRLAFDQPGTWSQKYNLIWDQILHLGIFDPEIARTEIRYYLGKLQPYGLPLDSRHDYTKSDWVMWTAVLAESRNDFEALVSPIYRYANETPTRIPLCDWHRTDTGVCIHMYARSVVGGYFAKMLAARMA